MNLSWRDALTTILALCTGTLMWAKNHGWSTWLTAPRLGVLTLGIIGIAMCASGSFNTQNGGPWIASLSILGGISVLLIILGLITGWAWIFYTLGAAILVLWFFSTLRHAITA